MISFEVGLLGIGNGGIGREAESLYRAIESFDEIVPLTWSGASSDMGKVGIQQRFPRRQALGLSLITRRLWRLRSAKGSDLFLPQVLPFSARGKIVVRLHDVFPLSNPEWFTPRSVVVFNHALKKLVKRGAYFISDTVTSENELLRFYPNANTLGILHCYIPPLRNGVACGHCQGCSFDTNQKYFLAVSTVEPRKNYPFLISLLRKYPQFTIVAAGRPGWKSEETLENLKNTPGMHYLQHICDGALGKLYANAYAFLSPTLAEGFNIPACEAEQFGLPVLLSDVEVHRELHPDEELLPVGDIDAWKVAMSMNLVRREPKVFPTFEEYAKNVQELFERGGIGKFNSR